MDLSDQEFLGVQPYWAFRHRGWDEQMLDMDPEPDEETTHLLLCDNGAPWAAESQVSIMEHTQWGCSTHTLHEHSLSLSPSLLPA